MINTIGTLLLAGEWIDAVDWTISNGAHIILL